MSKVRTIDSLEGLECGVLYKTKNYDILKDTEGNRAGLNERRIKKFQKLIKRDRFINEVSITLVNKKGKKIDGHHRSAAVEREGLPVYFMITDSSEFNGTSQDKILNNIARINSSINPTWSKEDHFKSALKSGLPLATKLEEIKEELSEECNIPSKNISTNDLYGILKADISSYGKKITRAELQDASLVKEVETPRFREDVIFYARLMMYFKNSPVRSYKAVKQVFREMWLGDIDFNKSRFLENLLNLGYVVRDDSVEEHRRTVRQLALHTRRGRRNKNKIENELEQPKLESLEVS